MRQWYIHDPCHTSTTASLLQSTDIRIIHITKSKLNAGKHYLAVLMPASWVLTVQQVQPDTEAFQYISINSTRANWVISLLQYVFTSQQSTHNMSFWGSFQPIRKQHTKLMKNESNLMFLCSYSHSLSAFAFLLFFVVSTHFNTILFEKKTATMMQKMDAEKHNEYTRIFC